MAKRKTYKKKEDNFVRNALIVFGSIIAVLVVVMIVSSLNDLSYSSFEHLDTYEEYDNQVEDNYAVYIYSESCVYCSEIKNHVLEFANENEAGLKVYFIDVARTTGSSSVLPSEVGGTPSLIIVNDGVAVDVFGGAEDIPAFFDDVNDGSYTFN